MDKYEEKCKALLDSGREQNGQFAGKKDRELSFYRHMFHYYKKYFNKIYSQAILDQQHILKELKEVGDSLILEKQHNKKLKEQNEIIKNSKNGKINS